jgi:SHS2 domain-containing protein
MSYEYIDHTADIGIRVRSKDLVSLFEDAGSALVDMMGASSGEGPETLEITAEGIDHVDLLVRWLQELLYLIEVKAFRISALEIRELSDTMLRAGLTGACRPTQLSHEIKAVTYHGLDICGIDNGFEATIIFDM